VIAGQTNGHADTAIDPSALQPEPTFMWRLMKHCRGTASWNMAVDEAMMRGVVARESPPTLRLYQWEGFAVSIGRFQNIERTMYAPAISDSGIPLVRRITGGRGILHGDDLTISIACRCADLGISSRLRLADIYAVLTDIMRMALVKVGVDSVRGQSASREPRSRSGDCFAITSEADLIELSSGEKVVGGAIHRCDDVVLFQGSAPLHSRGCADSVRELADRSFRGAAVQVHGSRQKPISRDNLENAIVQSLCYKLQARVVVRDQTEHEKRISAELQSGRYCNPFWTKSDRSIGDLSPN